MKIKDLIWSIGTSALVALCSLLSGVLLARSLEPNLRGQVAALLAWIAILSTLGEFGIGFAVMYYAGKDKSKGSLLFSQATLSALVVGITTVIMSAPLIDSFVSTPNVTTQVKWLALSSVCFSLLAGHISMVLLGLGYLREFNFIRICGAGVYSASIVLLFTRESRVPNHFILAYWISQISSASAAILFAIWIAGLRWRLQWDGIRSLLSYGLKTQVAAISAQANLRLDQLVISLYLEAKQLGLYVVAVAVSQALFPIYSGITSAIPPRVLAEPSVNQGARSGLKLVGFGILVGSIGTAALWWLLPWLVPLVFGSSYSGAIFVGRILIIASVFQGANQMLGTVLRSTGAPGAPAKAEGIGLICTVCLLSLLLPKFGITGAAFTSLVTYGTVATIETWFLISRMRHV